MNKIKMLAIFVGILIFSESAAIVHFVNKSGELSRQLKNAQRQLDNIEKQLKDTQ